MTYVIVRLASSCLTKQSFSNMSKSKRKADSGASGIEKKKKAIEPVIISAEANYEIHHKGVIYRVRKSTLADCKLLKDGDVTGLDKEPHFDVPAGYSAQALEIFLQTLEDPFGGPLTNADVQKFPKVMYRDIVKVCEFFGHVSLSNLLGRAIQEWTSIGEYFRDHSFNNDVFVAAELALMYAPRGGAKPSGVYIHLVRLLCDWVCTSKHASETYVQAGHKQPRVLLNDIFKGSPQLMLDVLLMSTLDRWQDDRDRRELWFAEAYEAKEKHPRD